MCVCVCVCVCVCEDNKKKYQFPLPVVPCRGTTTMQQITLPLTMTVFCHCMKPPLDNV